MFFKKTTTFFVAVILIIAAVSQVKTSSQYSRMQQVAAAPEAPADTPIPVVTEILNEWTLHGGLLYWARRCPGGEFRGDGYLRRKPANGGTTRTLSSVDSDHCYTFKNMAADDSGLYYHAVDGGNGIYHRPVDDPYDPATKVFTTTVAQEPVGHLALDGDYVYWITAPLVGDHFLLRVRNDGTGFGTVAGPLNSPDDLLVVDGQVYWLDDNGLWGTNVSCGSLPCPATLLFGVRGDHLLYHEPDTFPWLFQIYLVADGDPIESMPQTIRRYGCWWVINPFPDPPDIVCDIATLYTAPSLSWDIGELGTDGSHLFWPEKMIDMTDGRLRRMPIGGGTVDDIAVNMPYIATALFTDNLYVYFHDMAAPTIGIYRLPFDASAIVRDLAADEMEVTQGIQNLANDVPLTANKPTYVRAYGREDDGPHAVSVEAYLYGTRGGGPLPGSPLHGINGTRSLATGGSYDRVSVDDGWLFQLPDSWTDPGTVNLRVVVDPRGIYSDPNQGNNEMSDDFTFVDKAPVCTVYVPVRTHSPNYSEPTDNPNFWNMVDVAKRLWPAHDFWSYQQTSDVAELQCCWWGIIPYPCFGPYEIPDDTWKVLLSLNTRDFFSDDPDECDDANAKTHYVGMVHPDTNTNDSDGTVLGTANMNDNVAWVKFAPHTPTYFSDPAEPDAGATLVHELSHNLGRKHVDCGNPDDVDSGYPYITTTIGTVDAAGYYGFDSKTRSAIAPDAAKDLMSYCRPYWTSDYTWRAIQNRISSGQTSAASTQVNQTYPSLAMVADAVFVSGAVTPSLGTGSVNYAWNYPTVELSAGMLRKWQEAAVSTVGVAGIGSSTQISYHLRLLDDQDTVLADNVIMPMETIDQGVYSQVLQFVATFPAPVGTVARVELLADDTVLDGNEPGVSTPTVTLVKPAGGETFDDEMQIVWQAADADENDTLLYNVQYSPDDGQSWLSLLTDFPGPQDSDTVTATLLNLSVPGSDPNQGLVRVAASDGYNTGLATSNPFTVTNRKPEPYIASPAKSEALPAGRPVLLRGDANDAEDGGLSGSSLEWDVGGQASGTGEEQVVNGLAPGKHTVTLTARDSDAQEATAQVTFSVLPLVVPQGSEPLLDGFCDDGVYTESVQVQLAPYTGGAQATVHLLYSDDYLWACFSGMALGGGGPGAFVGVRADVDYSRDELAQSDDYGLFVGEDGGYFTYAGDGAGGFTEAGPDGLQAQVSANEYVWSAELRIDASLFGGWDRTIGMNLGHYWMSYQGDDYEWPYETDWNKPNTWATTVLGDLPVQYVYLPVVLRDS